MGVSCDKTLWHLQEVMSSEAEALAVFESRERRRKLPKQKAHMVYAVTSPLLRAVKIGRWTGSVDELVRRYKTYYGSELMLRKKYVVNSVEAERSLMLRFEDDRLTGEHWVAGLL